MVLFDLVKDKKDLISKDHMEAAASQLISKMRGGVIKKKDNNPELSFDKEESEIEEKGAKMLQVMDWAFDKANGSIPGFGTSAEMAERFLSKYGGVSEAISHLVNWQITSAATAGFVTSLGGLATMPLTLPANIAGVLAIQLRMVGAIADLGGMHENTEEKENRNVFVPAWCRGR